MGPRVKPEDDTLGPEGDTLGPEDDRPFQSNTSVSTSRLAWAL